MKTSLHRNWLLVAAIQTFSPSSLAQLHREAPRSVGGMSTQADSPETAVLAPVSVAIPEAPASGSSAAKDAASGSPSLEASPDSAAGEKSSERSGMAEELLQARAAQAGLKAAGGHFFDHIKVRGYTQFRYNGPTTNSQLVNLQGDRSMGGDSGFLIRRARLVLSGELHPLVSVYLQPDFASSTDSGLHFAQMRDWYVDLYEPSKEFRLRIGQSKIPYGFENMQSSQNRLPLDRSDAINSAFANERDLGAFLYYSPKEARHRFKHLVDSGLKGSGDYGVVGLGLFNGQTANKSEANANKHVVARIAWPFLFGKQYFEAGGGGYFGRYVVSRDEGISGESEFWDARGHVSLVLYPQPFGLQFEYNMGVGPELTGLQANSASGALSYTGTIEEKFLHGGYLLASYRWEKSPLGVLTPYARGMLYEGGKKHETNAPHYSVRELELGVEWQPAPVVEFVAALASAERSYSKLPYQSEAGHTGRFQLQINY